MNKEALKITVLTITALLAFAANSLFCRVALQGNSIDAASFTVVRLGSGALVLAVLLSAFNFRNGKQKTSNAKKINWAAASMLFLYAAGFSFAYITLEVATGALILMGAVQLTMITASVIRGERLHIIEWGGIIISSAGFVILMLPGVKTPSLTGFIFMLISGISWGIYSVMGKKSSNPLRDTASNFIYTIPAIILLALINLKNTEFTSMGLSLAFLSGGLASGVGYYIWYNALKGLTVTQAAIVQLLVPVIAAFGGIIFLSETITIRLLISALLILGGIGILVIKQSKWKIH